MSNKPPEPPEAFATYLARARPFVRVYGVFYQFVAKVPEKVLGPGIQETVYRCRYVRIADHDAEMDAMAAHLSGSGTCITLSEYTCFAL